MNMNDVMKNLPTPAVVIDLDVVGRNIRKMAEEGKKYGLSHRPHIKTHRSSELALWQVKEGCCGVTVAKLGEAEVMADAGIWDIFVAYAIIGQDKIDRLLSLARRCRISSAINSYVGAKALSDAFAAEGMKARVLIEVDGGIGVKTVERVCAAGADVIVCGNAVYAADDPKAAIFNVCRCGT